MAKEKVKVTETERKYELAVADLVPDTGDEAPTWCNLVAGLLDKFRVIPRLIMVAYIYAFYQSTTGGQGPVRPGSFLYEAGGVGCQGRDR